jgi:A/G-specific adenine glycosylase
MPAKTGEQARDPEEGRLILQLGKVLREKGVTRSAVVIFKKIITLHYRQHRRSLPWRRTRNSYRILVSEIMLQQTQVDRVIEKYALFTRTFPDFSSLAHAPLQDILKVWQGLGYNRRAIALRRIASTIVDDFHGRLPASKSELLALPGIGDYTASAILTFAFGQPSLFIETNIRRVFIHFFFCDRDSVSDADILPILKQTLEGNDPREWYYALMDYGAMLGKKVANPNRRSAHYRSQTRFEGSDRQVRGMILKTLLSGKVTSRRKLSAELGLAPQRLDENLARLIQEGFLKKEGKGFVIAK